jgi:rubrerythrin
MSFNPFEEKGIPIEKQMRPWSDLNVIPYDKNEVDPYTQARVILMNGIEVEAAIFGHEMARHTPDLELKKKCAMARRVEQQQQKVVNWLVPAEASILEATIGYEQLAVDLTAFFAQNVEDPYIRQVFEFGLLEDFDHLYRYANLMQLTEQKEAGKIVKSYTDILPGRPTIREHRHPYDDVRRFADLKSSTPKSVLYVMTLVAGEQQTMNFYMNMGNRIMDPVGRGVYLEIGQIEEQHVTQYESLLDPRMSWYEMLLLHEYNECWLYWSFASQEPDQGIKKIWEEHLEQEIEHLHIAAQLLENIEKRDARELVPEIMPDPLVLQPAVEYVREVLNTQVDYNAVDTEIVPPNKMPKDHRYYTYQKMVNGNWVPTEKVIEENIEKNGKDYRLEQDTGDNGMPRGGKKKGARSEIRIH